MKGSIMDGGVLERGQPTSYLPPPCSSSLNLLWLRTATGRAHSEAAHGSLIRSQRKTSKYMANTGMLAGGTWVTLMVSEMASSTVTQKPGCDELIPTSLTFLSPPVSSFPSSLLLTQPKPVRGDCPCLVPGLPVSG